MDVTNVKVDVIIPTYRPGNEMVDLLAKLEAQEHKIHRILILDTETGEFPYEAVGQYKNVEVHKVTKKQFDHGATRDKGVRMSKADVVILMTQDAIPVDTLLITNLVKAFSDQRVGISYARQLPREDCKEIERYTRRFNYPGENRIQTDEQLGKTGIKTYFCSDVCAAYNRKLYLSLGGFEHNSIFNEDMVMGSKVIGAGFSIVYVADAKVIHSHNYSYRKQFQRNFDLGVSQAQHPEVFAGVSSESEGMKLVRQTAGHLVKTGKPWLLPSLMIGSGMKYMGYRLGRHYRRIPLFLIRRFTMNKSYWH